MKFFVNVFVGTIITGITHFLGGWDIALKTLLLFIVLDYITGILKAIHNKKLNSIIGVKGIIKKIGYLIIITVAEIIDQIFGNMGTVRTIIIYFFITNEGISIVENWTGMGLPIPKILIEKLDQIKKRE